MNFSALQRINILNIGLLVLSAILATIHPVATFLFAYAVLGPLHYLTEIPWLHQRKYFTKHLWLALPFLVLCLALLFLPLDDKGASFVVAGAFFWGIAIATTQKFWQQCLLTLLALLLLVVSGMPPLLITVFGILLTTLVHVGVFTWLFMASGVRRTPEWSGITTLVLLPLLTVILLFPLPSFPPDTGLQAIYQSFASVNASLLGTTDAYALFQSSAGIAVLRIIAFLYTYHYLNWFSKTGVIGWHRLPKASLALILLLWIGSVALYAVDYGLGLRVLLFLSLLHVFLEFPLNAHTMRSVLQSSPAKHSSKA